jgi:hypothetical protein
MVLTIMNYQRIHDQIIERAKTRQLEGYKERHHIIPRCMNGTDDEDNLVDLTAREHFIIHKLLCEIYPDNDKLFFAYRMMAVMKNSYDNERLYFVGSREFERIRLLANQKIGNALRGRKIGKLSSDIIEKQVQSRQKKADLRGYYHSSETKKKIGDALRGKSKSTKHIEKIAKANTNNPKVTGKASTPEKELLRRHKIKESWKKRKEIL